MEPLLRAINLSKSFGTLSALQEVSFEIHPGEVVGLAGRSGSGKSVLTMLLAGFYAPDGGDIYFDGRRLQWPVRARAMGIEIIHQEPDLVEDLDIAGNMFLGAEIGWPAWGGWLKVPNRRRMEREAARILRELGVAVGSVREKAANLSSEQRQMVAIGRAMIRPARLIIVDEPTVLLSYSYQQRLLALIQAWQQAGIAVLFSSNNLDHLFAVTDRIIALRQGRQVADHRSDEASREEIVAALVGASNRQQLTPIIWALDSYYHAREQAEKLRHQQRLLERDLAAQDTVRRQLVDQLAAQVSALDQANLALQAAQRRLLTEREQERKRLARELHDQVIQDLLGVNYQLEEVEADEFATPALRDSLGDLRKNIRLMVEDLRRICGDLRPPTIDSLGLGAALQSYSRDWAERTGISLTLDLNDSLGRLPEAIELSIFRIVQEGLSNVRKHARASSVQVCLRHTSPRMLMVSIADDGRGLAKDFDLSALSAEGHYGLLGISERVALMGGRLRLQNQASGGLLLQVELPHPRVNTATDPIVLGASPLLATD
jgi:signal transduction histidine kinase